MRTMPVWGKVLAIIGICVALSLPLVLLLLNNPRVATLLPTAVRFSRSNDLSKRYSAQSEVPGYSLRLIDTSFLDFTVSKMDVFAPKAIIDPRFYQGYTDVKLRSTVSNVRFVLSPTVDHPVSFIVSGDGRTTPVVMVGQGSYSVQGDTLVITVSLDVAQLTTGLAGKYFLEDAFLRTALCTMYYAHGLPNNRPDPAVTAKIQREMQTYLPPYTSR